MSDFTRDEQAILADLREHFPETIASVEAAVERLVTQVADSFQGRFATEAEADHVLANLLALVISRTAPETPEPEDGGLMPGLLVSLVTRQVLAGARAGFVARVVQGSQD